MTHATAAQAEPITVTDADFDARVLRADGPVLVDFWATWCPPCKMLAPVLDQLAAEYAGRATIVKINTDENPRTAMKYGVMATPTLAVFRGGELVHQTVGARPKRTIARDLDTFL